MKSLRTLSVLFSLATFSLALLVMWLGRSAVFEHKDSVTVRKVDVMPSPPPPPPPPKTQQRQTEQSLHLRVEGQQAKVVTVDIPQSQLSIKLPTVPRIDTSMPEWQSVGVDIQVFELDNLDGLPMLLTPLRIKMPRRATLRGVSKIMISLRVLIDVDGSITLLEVLENDYPELLPQIKKMVQNSRFSAPMKDGVPVRARFVWPIAINS
ncbi:hypothetical protein [Neptunicella marina]|uniref:TonB C-terminal domain-containing protein n=1 Tax=Neptunicella marina TaxID=2125989 RepID=A0A8J6IR08_9ALTE|nr:hypothetical protein [Neptunicella marina]MBC3764774.1 hypothetical protein [Neptunicella marina]